MKFLLSLFLLIGIFSCTHDQDSLTTENISFYHWKTKAKETKVIKSVLQQAATDTVYMHYFDVVKQGGYDYIPKATLLEIDDFYKEKTIIPTIYLENEVLKIDGLSTKYLARRITDLLEEITEHHKPNTCNVVQIDCDWTESTEKVYFELLKKIQSHNWTTTITIRLHQIKYQNDVPPVSEGTLMIYNIGNLKSTTEHSIIEPKIVGDYINGHTTYPINLKIALPIYEQVVLFNNKNNVKIVSEIDQPSLQNTNVFEKVSPTLFEVKKDTFYKGFYIYEGYQAKLDTFGIDPILESIETIKKSPLRVNGYTLYHLDDSFLNKHEITPLINAL